jgi:hypothetical protein
MHTYIYKYIQTHTCTHVHKFIATYLIQITKGSATPVPVASTFRRSKQVLFAAKKRANTNLTAAIVICDKRTVYSARRDALYAIDMVKSWMSAIIQRAETQNQKQNQFSAHQAATKSDTVQQDSNRITPASVRVQDSRDQDTRAHDAHVVLSEEQSAAVSRDQDTRAHDAHVVLNEEQRAAVEAEVGAVLVLAGPGSGEWNALVCMCVYVCIFVCVYICMCTQTHSK